MAKRARLNEYEKGIESAIDTYVPIADAQRRRVDQILSSARKSKNINIRISEPDLASLKKNAEDEGIPYQTLISSVLHKYLAGRLYEEKHIRKSIELLTRKQQVT